MKKSFFDYLFVCHKLPSRSFFFRGKQFPICARCTGMFIGYIIAIITLFFYYPNIFYTVLLIVPIALDGGIQYFTCYESTNWRRLITGILGGMASIFLFANVAHYAHLHANWLIEQLNL